MALLFRGIKKHDELFDDYLKRLSFWNGFLLDTRFSMYIYKHFGISCWGPEDGRIDKYNIKIMLETLLRRNIQIPSYKYYKKKKGTLHYSNICPLCWNKSRHIRYYWHMEAYSICHIHNIELIDPVCFSYDNYYFNDRRSAEECENRDTVLYKVLVKSIEYYAHNEHSYELVEIELEQHSYILDLIEWVFDFFKKYFKIRLKLKLVYKLVYSGVLAGLSVINKMNKVYTSLLFGNEKYERQVRIITTIRVGDSTKRDGYYLNYASPPNGFFRWLKSEVLSLDDLFHIHIGVGYRKRISKKFTIFNNVEGFEKLKSYPDIDRKLCLAICSYDLKWPYEVDQDLLDYQAVLRNSSKNEKNLKYSEYLASIGHRVVDEEYTIN